MLPYVGTNRQHSCRWSSGGPFDCGRRRSGCGIAISLAVSVVMVGCGGTVVTSSFDRILDWSTDGDSGVSGLDTAVVVVSEFQRRTGPPTRVVVWTDIKARRPSHTYVGSGSPEREISTVRLSVGAAGDHLDVTTTLFRNGSGELEVDGRRFDLDQGEMFLVSTKSVPIAIKQLDRDTFEMSSNKTSFQRMAKSDAEIRQFFTAASE